MKKDDRDQIKDVGGFVGGYLAGGIRKNGQVRHRQLITLDLDDASPDFWDDLQLAYGNAAVVYSTHSSTARAPRLRLIMPLASPVTEEQYEPIARRIAEVLGMDQFDQTTYEPTRLMYWPSTPKDGVYIFLEQDGPWLDPAEILGTYVDWTDSSSWPVAPKEHDRVRRSIKKQQDPLDKPGIVGAFCRTYDIHEAITKFLPEVYTETAIPGRYTFNGGSTAAGLVTYDDKFAYSHHGTDPIGGQLCNAFDLVRIHLYGPQDDETAEDTPINRTPSYLAMEALAATDPAVKTTVVTERSQAARDEFEAEPGSEDQPSDDSWTADLEITHKGQIKSSYENLLLIIQNDPWLKGKFIRDDFAKEERITGDLPWRKYLPEKRWITDRDTNALMMYLEKHYGVYAPMKAEQAFNEVIHRNSRHPVKEYLYAQSWDGTPRAETLLIDYLGAEDSPYTRAVTRKALTAAVARIEQPGCKFDYVLTMVGSQGVGKSTLAAKLGRDWYSDNLYDMHGRDGADQIQGKWIVELGELAAMKRSEVEQVKNFISRQTDTYRAAYARKKESHPRSCIFLATTNDERFLQDITGNRRFWPVPVDPTYATRDIHRDLTSDTVGQIWAEAMRLFLDGEDLYLDRELEAAAKEVQKQHTEKDPRTEIIADYLDKLVPETWDEMDIYRRRAFLMGDELASPGTRLRNTISVAEIWCECLGGHVKDMNSHNTKPLHGIMKQMDGWRRGRSKSNRGDDYDKQHFYIRIDSPENDYFL
jgi:predicted P-loop ATPase